jgi:hypothetical protein
MTERFASLRCATEAGSDLQLFGRRGVRGGDSSCRQLDAEATRECNVQLAERPVGAGVVFGHDDHLSRPHKEAAVVERLGEHQPGIAVGVYSVLTVPRCRKLAEQLLGPNELSAGGYGFGVRRGDQKVKHGTLRPKRVRLVDDAKRLVRLAQRREVVPGSDEKAHGPFRLRRGDFDGNCA